MYKKGALCVAFLAVSMVAASANTTQEVTQVTGTVTLSSGVDYVVTSATPFAAGSVVDITDTDNAVLILKHVQPSAATGLLSFVRINGQAAVNNSNCQVKIYANGSIIMPYANDMKPLTVYTGLDQTGETAQFATGGRQSLLGKSVNNRIRSIVLKRGYMATFMTKSDGKGYSRVFVADKADLRINMPAILDQSISALRVLQWNDVSKKGLAGRDATLNTALKTTWDYNWDAGTDNLADREFVTQRHHEAGTKNGTYEGAWPSVDDCSNNGTSPHILGQNEPDNTSDPREVITKVEDLLAIWPDLMATGKRLGSPAMSSNLNMLYQFLDSIDARGWRCDFVAVHSYWYSDWSSWQWNFNSIHNRTGRPLWITELNYGANWTGWPGADRSGSDANFAIEKQHMAPILDGMESTSYLERYAFYNWVEDCRSAYLNDALTPIGEYYANIESNVAFNSTYEYVPKLPASKGSPSDLAVRYDSQTGTAALSWYEPSGEYNKSMTVERRTGSNAWVTVADVTLQEDAANYTLNDNEVHNGDVYRIHVVYADGKDYYSKTVTAVPDQLAVGDAVNVDSTTYYIGGNLLVNGDFDLGMQGWTNGVGTTISQPYFEVFPVGGYDGGSYLQAFAHGGADKVESVKTLVDLIPNTNYYCSSASRFDEGVSYLHFGLTADGVTENQIAHSIASTSVWSKQATVFNSGTYSKGFFTFRWLSSKAQLDQLRLSRLFATKDEALADGLAAEQRRAEAVETANTVLPMLNESLKSVVSTTTTPTEANVKALAAAINQTLLAMRLKVQVDSASTVAQLVIAEQLDGSDLVAQALQDIASANTAESYVTAARALKTTLDASLPFVSTDKVVRGDFADGSPYGWNTKSGTYTGGTQAVATVAGKQAWNAQWTGLSSSEGAAQSMAINQTVSGLTHGLYVLECKAATQHYSLADQHAYLRTKTDSICSPLLKADYLDLPTLDDSLRWQSLTTTPVYLSEKDTITIGFTGTKNGAVDNAWREYNNTASTGDMREGSWVATDFVLRHLPVYHTTVGASGWSTICLPYVAKPTPGVKFYRVAGMSTDSTRIYIEEISESAAGVPCIIYSDHPDVIVLESGTAVTRTTLGANNLRGMFITSATVPQYCLTLVDGVWVNQDNPDRALRPYLQSFQAFINRLTGVSVLASWSGLSMPITTATGIVAVSTSKTSTEEYYTLDGRKVNSTDGLGVYIRVKDGKATKVVKGIK
ncbi:MAG: hypothetical protein I3J02_04385 [Prevotella sp.]|nr:hypothetical protein [Prevotella sp.]